MLKKLFVLALVATFFVSACKQSANDGAKVTVAGFDKDAPTLVEKQVQIEGTVSHTCKHGGKRMFLVDGNDSIMVEITTGKDIAKFDEKLVGSKVRVFGTVKELRIDEKYLSEWENELKKPAENHDAGVHDGSKGHEDQSAEDKFAQINSYREEIKKSGTDHLSFYSIEAAKFEEVK